ncbi:MAG: mannitol dehydrogenase family protein [Termitinemataceae bacterium]|nr:MAG: mannitol dehydrogenase family protein [Termitinemataceae bacterium]
MLEINKEFIKNKKSEFEKAGVHIGNVDLDALVKRTHDNPRWVHFGAGNLFKAYHAVLSQRLVEGGFCDTGIIAVVPNDFSNMEILYTKHDNLFLQVVMKADGSLEKRIISAVTEFVAADTENDAAWSNLKEIFAKPSLQMVTISITEKAHNLFDTNAAPKASFSAQALKDFEDGLKKPMHAMTKLTALLLERFNKGAHPIALVSTDNFSHNGDKLKAAIVRAAEECEKRSKVSKDFVSYLKDEKKVSFPLSMIDKITPYSSAAVAKDLQAAGIAGMEITKTERGSSTAAFVNTEEAEYLVIEDVFPNGRPPLEKVGVYFTTRDKVDMVERMKVCTCLNPLHTALAIYGCLLGYKTIAEEMQDRDLASLANKIGYIEGMPVVTDPQIIKPQSFINDVLTKRLPNPNIPDTPQRIATDTSQKLSIRFGETIKLYVSRSDLDVKRLVLIPLVLSAWCRYLLGIDDEGNTFTVSPDPLLESLQEQLKGVTLGKSETANGKLKSILSNATIFGSNLYEAGLGERIENYFVEMLAGKGAVRKTLQKYVMGVKL